MNKRAQGLSTNAIVLIILAVIVLVVLIIGFTMGWGQISSIFKSNNVQTIVTACDTSCSTGSTYEFCNSARELKDDEGNKIKTTCNVFSNVPEYVDTYGIQKCSTLCDKQACADISLIIDGKEIKGVVGSAACVVGQIDVTALASDADASATPASYCCAQ